MKRYILYFEKPSMRIFHAERSKSGNFTLLPASFPTDREDLEALRDEILSTDDRLISLGEEKAFRGVISRHEIGKKEPDCLGVFPTSNRDWITIMSRSRNIARQFVKFANFIQI